MTMGEMGDYVFIDAAGQTIGATMNRSSRGHRPAGASISAPPISMTPRRRSARPAARCMTGPMEVPGGDRIIVANDPHGVVFGAVGPGNQ